MTRHPAHGNGRTTGEERRFSPRRHIPHYSSLLIRALQTPLLVYFALAGNFVTLISATLFYEIEHPHNPNVRTFFDAIWWAFCTVSTVGFGDIVPVTVPGRMVAIFLMITGIGFFVGFTAVLVSIISEEMTKREYQHVLREVREISRKIDARPARSGDSPGGTSGS